MNSQDRTYPGKMKICLGLELTVALGKGEVRRQRRGVRAAGSIAARPACAGGQMDAVYQGRWLTLP